MKKSVWCWILSTTLLVSIFCVATSITVSAETSGDYEYKISNGQATITAYNGSSTKVVIPSTIDGYPVTTIGWEAFWGRKSLTSITIPNGVTKIDGAAFGSCTALKTVVIPKSVTIINREAFRNCKALTAITLPSTLTTLGSDVFSYCTSLTSIVIPNRVTAIQSYAFEECTALKSVTIGSGVKTIERYAFKNCGLTKLTIPNNVTSIEDSAFYSCDLLTSVTIGNGLKTVNSIFGGCKALKTVKFGSGLTKIASYAFTGCALENITIPDNVKVIEGYAFADNHNLKTVSIGNSVKKIDDNTFAGCENLTKITLNNSVTSIGWTAFYGCSSLKSITLPKTLKAIGNSAFEECSSLKTVSYNGTKSQWDTIDILGNNTPLLNAKRYYAAAINTQPKSVGVANGKTAKVTVKASGAGLTYKWYYKNKGASKFTYTSSFKSSSYSFTMSSARAGRQVYCVITDQFGNTVKSRTVTLDQAVRITTQPKSACFKNGKMANATVKASGTGLKYKWYYKNKGASKYTYASSFKTNKYSVAMNGTRNGQQVYCVVTDQYGNSVKSKVVTLDRTVTISTQPKSVNVASGKTAKVTVKADGVGLKYTWYYKDKGSSTYKKATSFKSASYSVAMTKARAGRKVYCVVTDKYGNKVKSNVVTLGMK